MKIIDVRQRSDEWLALRRGAITGTKLKNIIPLRGTTPKIGYYELIAERLATEPTDESPMQRGTRLEEEATEAFEKHSGLKVEQVGLCVRDDNENIAVSPDGLIKEEEKYTGAIEIKCLSSAKHLEAYIERKIPKEYHFQILQNFIVNDDLESLHFVFYDPRVTCMPLHTIDVEREQLEDEIEERRAYQENMLEEVETICLNLGF